MRVLVVEDSKVSQQLVTAILERHGFEVGTADNGQHALQAICDAAYDAIVTDLVMPDMDGLELIRAVRSDPRTARMPIIICSSLATRQTVAQAVKLGIQDYIVKPIDGNVLVRRLRKMEKLSSAPSTAGIESTLDRLRMHGQREFLRTALAELVRETKATLVKIGDAFCASDPRRVGVLAMKIQGDAANLGANSIAEAAGKLAQCATDWNFEAAIGFLGELEGALHKVADFVSHLPGEPGDE